MSPASRVWGIDRPSAEGVQQGDGLAGVAFAVALQPHLVKAAESLEQVKGIIASCSDDVYIRAPANIAFAVAMELRDNLLADLGLELQVTKSTAYARDVVALRTVMDSDPEWGGVLDPTTGIRTGGFSIGTKDGVDGWSAAYGDGFGLTLAGLPLGDVSYTQATLTTKTDKILEDNQKMSLLLRIASPQGLQAVCVYCCQSLLAYETQNLPPSVTIPHLKRLDKSLLEMMEVATRLDCLSGESLDPLILRRVRMPVSKRGVGLRSQEWVAPMAFAGGFLHAITAIQNMCPELGDWLHGPALHDDDRRAERLKFFTEESESPLRGAFTAAWSEIR